MLVQRAEENSVLFLIKRQWQTPTRSLMGKADITNYITQNLQNICALADDVENKYFVKAKNQDAVVFSLLNYCNIRGTSSHIRRLAFDEGISPILRSILTRSTE